jgi:hypothetical protein
MDNSRTFYLVGTEKSTESVHRNAEKLEVGEGNIHIIYGLGDGRENNVILRELFDKSEKGFRNRRGMLEELTESKKSGVSGLDKSAVSIAPHFLGRRILSNYCNSKFGKNIMANLGEPSTFPINTYFSRHSKNFYLLAPASMIGCAGEPLREDVPAVGHQEKEMDFAGKKVKVREIEFADGECINTKDMAELSERVVDVKKVMEKCGRGFVELNIFHSIHHKPDRFQSYYKSVLLE